MEQSTTERRRGRETDGEHLTFEELTSLKQIK